MKPSQKSMRRASKGEKIAANSCVIDANGRCQQLTPPESLKMCRFRKKIKKYFMCFPSVVFYLKKNVQNDKYFFVRSELRFF